MAKTTGKTKDFLIKQYIETRLIENEKFYRLNKQQPVFPSNRIAKENTYLGTVEVLNQKQVLPIKPQIRDIKYDCGTIFIPLKELWRRLCRK